MAKKSFKEWIWPTIIDQASARQAAKQGVYASLFCVAATVVLLVLSMTSRFPGVSPLALIDAVIAGLIGWGIYKMNRLAAAVCVPFYLFERVFQWMEHGSKNPILAIIITLAFINGTRGVFAFHEFRVARILARQSQQASSKSDDAMASGHGKRQPLPGIGTDSK